ncbi:MAG: (2Fe-2S)-binding protein [Epsilonproteobacteria bacterium]|nr:2-hydroxymethylglutarate dehydrogenase [Campylobacterota bacterium]NPA57634.1 (2Fe-2S)-binding protein [Campylobacterota bacterium]
MQIDQLSSIDDLYVVCECMEVTYGEIVKAIREGNCDLESLMKATGAGTTCGKCRSRESDPADERAIHLDEILSLAKGEGLCPEE